MKRRRFFDRFPEFETEKLQLIEIKPEHRSHVLRHFSDERVSQFLDISPMASLEDAGNLIDFLHTRFVQERGIRWAIRGKGQTDIMGTCGFNSWKKRRFLAELGYDLSVPYRRQGIMTEAVKRVMEFGFNQMGLQTIEAYILPDNVASEAFIQHLGFTWEALVKDYQVSTGQYAHMQLYYLKKAEWLSGL